MTLAARPFRVVLIGPESTGKTWLAERLAAAFGVPWSGEYARAFVEENPRPVVFEDVDAIGRGQVANEDAVIARARAAESPIVIHDTDLVSTEVYSRHYYGDCPPWIPPEVTARLADLYLLLEIDVPWMEDGHMRAAPERRRELFELFRSTLSRLGARVVLVRGTWDERFAGAVAALRESRPIVIELSDLHGRCTP